MQDPALQFPYSIFSCSPHCLLIEIERTHLLSRLFTEASQQEENLRQKKSCKTLSYLSWNPFLPLYLYFFLPISFSLYIHVLIHKYSCRFPQSLSFTPLTPSLCLDGSLLSLWVFISAIHSTRGLHTKGKQDFPQNKRAYFKTKNNFLATRKTETEQT